MRDWLRLDCGDERVDRLYLHIALLANIFEHASREAGIGSAEGDGSKVSQNHISVAERYSRSWNFTGNHLLGVIEKILVVWCAAGVANDKTDPRPASSAPAALGVVIGTRRDVAEDDGVQAAHVNAHLHCGRARKHVEWGFGR